VFDGDWVSHSSVTIEFKDIGNSCASLCRRQPGGWLLVLRVSFSGRRSLWAVARYPAKLGHAVTAFYAKLLRKQETREAVA
jgi:hypothetical protein